MAVNGCAPYKSVLTHGFTVDGEGRKMSKSVGNTVAPQEVIEQYGADVMRLWVSSADYQGDIRLSPKILKQLSDVYRKIRNTFRYLLGNLSDFNPETDAVAYADMTELDKWLLCVWNKYMKRLRKPMKTTSSTSCTMRFTTSAPST